MVDNDIRKLIDDKVLYCDDGTSQTFMKRYVSAISYDLHTHSFVMPDCVNMDEYRLAPGESVFVSCRELIRLPDDICARIVIRNSRMRQGLSLEAPVYQPGHHTRIFFRLTNLGSHAVSLDTHGEYAAIMFERLSSAADSPYHGTFQNEMVYNDMADYTSKYKEELIEIEEKKNEIKHLEKNIYTNTITLMSIFIALFSLINVNVDIALAGEADLMRVVLSNLVTIGSISFLVSLIQLCFSAKDKRNIWVSMLAVSLAILAIATLIVICK